MHQCSRCGTQNDDQAFACYHCGLPLDGVFTQVLGATNRRVEWTPHFELHMPAGSFAEQRLGEIGAQLEGLLAVLAGILGMAPEAFAPERIRVYLGDTLPDPSGSGQTFTVGSWAVPERLQIWSVFRPDAPGIDLDRATIRILMLRATGADLAAMPLIWTGLAGLCGQRLGYLPPEPFVSQTLLTQTGGRTPSLGMLWGGPAFGEEQIFFLIALSFVDFLLQRNGPDALLTFIVGAAGAIPDQPARAVYHIPLAALERNWWKAVHKRGAVRASGIGRFLRGALHYLRPYWKQEILILIFLGVQLAFQQILPRAQALLIDRAILHHDLRFLLELSIFLFGMVVLLLLAGVFNDLLTARVSESVLRTLRERMFARLQQASHRFYQRLESGDIISRFSSDLRSVEQGLTSTLTQGIFLMLSLAISTVHILLLNWMLALGVLATLPLFLITTRILGPRANRASLDFSQQQAVLTSVLQEDIAAQPVVKAYNLQMAMVQRFGSQTQVLYRAAVRLFFLSSLFGVSANLLTTAVQVGVLGVGGYFVIEGRLQLGSLIEFLALLSLVIGPVQNVTGLLQAIQVATASMDRVEEILNHEPEVRDTPDAVQVGPLRYGIRMEQVTFSYKGDQPQLEGISLDIQAGQHVAFVGPSGSGKSTIVSMILRFYDPDYGRILFDGNDTRAISLESLRNQIGIVFQESFLFNTTVRENIRFGQGTATDAEVEDAARKAAIHDAIMQMPQGYDTIVGERGGSLSGGQRQRLAIARAILRRPSVLVLDEATSALDPRTENEISHTLASLSVGRTTISVTHRLASAATADRIFVLDQGRLVEQGTHEELLEANGLYRRLYEEQGGGAVAGQRALEIAYLRGVPIFAGLSTAALSQIAAFLRYEQVAAGETVIAGGTRPNKLYLIISGELEVEEPSVAERRRVLANLGPGGYFGEVALLRDAPRSATVRARTAADLLTLDKQTLYGLYETVPHLHEQIEAAMAARAAAAGPPAGASAVPARARPKIPAMLERREGEQTGEMYALIAAETGLGRNKRNAIVIRDGTVSAYHARICRLEDGRYEVTDSGSTNGTRVNGRRIDAPVKLRDGDKVRLGDVNLVFHEPPA